MNWLLQIAPTVASALGGPLAGIAVTALSKALGVAPHEVNDMIQSNKLTADQIAQVKLAEIELKQQEETLGLKFAELETEDRVSARNMQISQPSKLVPIIAISVILSFLITTVCTLAGWTHADSVLAGTLIGYLSAKAEQVISFYFGSSHGSQKKDQMIFNSTPIKPGQSEE
jgi:hypothetical protein